MSHSKPSTRAFLQILAPALFFPFLVGCGGSAPPPVVTYPNLTGNWQFNARITIPNPPSIPTNPIETLFGSLTTADGKVTGTLNARTIGFPPCVANNADLPVTGTVDASGNLNLTAPISGGVATITATVVAQLPLPSIPNGTYQVIGGPCAQPSIQLLGFEVPNASGTYAGTMTQIFPTGSGSIAVKAVLAESSTPNADGEFPLSGTITYTGDCSATLSFTNGVAFGEELQSGPISPDFSTSTELFSAGAPLRPSEPMLAMFFLPAGCSASSYHGTLTPQ
jgi:hypothetical protein